MDPIQTLAKRIADLGHKVSLGRDRYGWAEHSNVIFVVSLDDSFQLADIWKLFAHPVAESGELRFTWHAEACVVDDDHPTGADCGVTVWTNHRIEVLDPNAI